MSEKKLSELKMQRVEHYAEVFYQKERGVYDIETQAIAERTLEQIKFRQGACGFKFFDKKPIQKILKGNRTELSLERTNKSCFTHIGEFLTLAQVGNECGEDSHEYASIKYFMTQGNCKGVVKTVNGYYNKIYREEKVIAPSQIKFIDQANEQAPDAEREM